MLSIAKKSALPIVAVLVFALVGGNAFAGGQEERDVDPADVTLEMWSFTDELEPAIEIFEERTGAEINLTIIPTEDYMSRIRPVLRSGVNAPDIFTGEAAFVRQLVNSGFWEPLDQEPYNAHEHVDKYYPYVPQVATDEDGALRALSWQTTPGGTFYRRSLAEEYLGTDDPDEVGEYFSSYDGIIELGRLLQEESDGEVAVLPEVDSTLNWYLPERDNPWVDAEGRFHLDDIIIDHLEFARTMRQEGLLSERDQWTPAWFEGMNEVDDPDTFAFTLPTWGLHFVLKGDAPDSSGDWAVTHGPTDYFWGGTWLGVYSGSDHKELAWQFVEMMTLDEEFLEQWARDTGDFLGHREVVDRIVDDFSDPYLAGQNHYQFFAEAAPGVDGSLMTEWDEEINGFVHDARDQYMDDDLTLDEAIEYIYDEVEGTYPQFEVRR